MGNRLTAIMIVAITLALSGRVLAQMSPEEAQAMLEASKAAREAAATQPVSAAEYEGIRQEVLALHKQIIELQAQVAALQAENARLRSQTVGSAATTQPASTFESRAIAAHASQPNIIAARLRDKQIGDILKKHPEFRADTAAVAYADKVVVGMPWETAKLFVIPGFVIVTIKESTDFNVYEMFQGYTGRTPYLDMVVKAGLITQITYQTTPYAPQGGVEAGGFGQ